MESRETRGRGVALEKGERVERLVSVCPPDVYTILLEIDAVSCRADINRNVGQSVKLLQCRRVDTFWTLASVAEPQIREARIDLWQCQLETARYAGQRASDWHGCMDQTL